MTTPGDELGPEAPDVPGTPDAASSTERVPSSDDVVVALHDLGGDGPTLLLCHPSGFSGMVLAPLAARLRDAAHCWALDARGHGDSTLPASGSMAWQGTADDVLAVVDHLGERPLLGFGHSMGGAALLLAELARPGTFRALWCYEPIVFPPFEGPPPPGSSMADGARRRRAIFPDRAAALANYAAKPPLDVLDPEALAAYVTYGFRDRPDGQVELKCSPETEARTFEAGVLTAAFPRLGLVACPVTVAAGNDTSPPTGAPPAKFAPLVADALPHGQLRRFPTLGHFGPLEDPTTVANAIRTDFV